MSDVQNDEVSFRHMIRNGLNNESVEVSYAVDVVFSDENTDGNMRTSNATRKKDVV